MGSLLDLIDLHYYYSPTHWDIRLLNWTLNIAKESEDTTTKVGALIVGKTNEIRSTGYNGLPRGISRYPEERHSKKNNEKFFWYEHAERNAIYNAARVGIPINGCRIYIVTFPKPIFLCAVCARTIIQSGIKQVIVGHVIDLEHNETRKNKILEFYKKIDYLRAMEMFDEVGIDYKICFPKEGKTANDIPENLF